MQSLLPRSARAELIANPEGEGNPLGSVAYRFGAQQVNVHGPWPGRADVYCRDPSGNGIELITYTQA